MRFFHELQSEPGLNHRVGRIVMCMYVLLMCNLSHSVAERRKAYSEATQQGKGDCLREGKGEGEKEREKGWGEGKGEGRRRREREREREVEWVLGERTEG